MRTKKLLNGSVNSITSDIVVSKCFCDRIFCSNTLDCSSDSKHPIPSAMSKLTFAIVPKHLGQT